MSRRARIWSYIGASLVALIIVLAIVSIRVLSSDWFANYVREKIVSVTEESTGGKAELGSFAFDWRHLHATLTNFVLHGTEPAGDPPLFRAAKIDLRLKLLAGLKKTIDLQYLGIDQPSANIIVFADGTTNVPEPKVVKKSNKNGLETIVDLAIGQFDISNGTVALAHRSMDLNVRGENLHAQLFYRLVTSKYVGDVAFTTLRLTPKDGQPLSASVDLPIEIGKDNIDLKNARVATSGSQIVVTGSLSHLDSPVIAAHVMAHVSLQEVKQGANLAMVPCKGTPCFVDADVDARMDDQKIQITTAKLNAGKSNIEASGILKDPSGKNTVQFNGKLALDEIGRLLEVSAKPQGEVSLSGNAQFQDAKNYNVNGKISGQGIGFTAGTERLRNVSLSSDVAADANKIALNNLRVGALGAEIAGNASLVDFERFQLQAQLRHFQLRELETQFLGVRARSPGQVYDGSINGNVDASGDLKAPGAGLRAAAKLSIAPGSRGVPVSGRIDGQYDGPKDLITLSKSYITLPHSRLELSGVLGTSVLVDFTSTNTNDLSPALAMAEKEPPKEMPVTLRGGKLELHARLDGPLSSPRITGHVAADRFAVEQRPFDSVSAEFAASSMGASLQNGLLARQSLQAQFSASVGMRNWSAGNNSPVEVALDFRNGELPDVLALAGESDIPATGMLNASARISGTIGNPQGSLQATAMNGMVYEEPFDRLDMQVNLSDQLIRLASLDLVSKAGRVQANGTFTHPRDSLTTGHVQLHAAGNGIQVGQIAKLEKMHPGISGTLQLDTDAAADLSQAAGQTEFMLKSVRADVRAQNIRDNGRSFGNLTARADTSGSTVNYQVDSDLIGSSIKVTGRTTLTKEYPTVADASIQNLSIESALDLAGQSLPARGTVTLNGHVAGTLSDPTADVQLAVNKAMVYEEPIDTLQLQAHYTNKDIEVPSLRVSTPAGELNATASFVHPANQFDSGRIQLHTQSGDIRLAQVKNVQAQKPGLAGTLKLVSDVAGDLKTTKGEREFMPSKLDVDLSANAIAYNGKAYGNAAITANTRGDTVAFKVDSNFANAAIHGTGEAKLQADYPLTAQLSIADVRYSNLRGFLSGDSSVRPDFDALVEAQATVSGPAKMPLDMRGNLRISRLELSTGQTPGGQTPGGQTAAAQTTAGKTGALALKNDGPIVIDVNRSVANVQSAKLTGPSTQIALSGTAGFSGANPLNLTFKANTDLSLIQQIDKDIHSSGAVIADTTIRGTLSQPAMNGKIQLKDASINVETTVSNGISHANGVIELNGSGARIQNLTAESGGGKITVTGGGSLTGSTPRYALRVNADHVRTRYQGVTVVNSAALQLNGTADRSVLTGTVTIQRVGFNPQSDIGSILSQTSMPQAIAPTEATGPLAGMHFDLRIRTAADVRFETALARKLQATADLNLVGTPANPGMVGRVDITEGDLVFFGNEYTVDRGTIAFYDPTQISPQLNISLETSVLNVEVTLSVSGPMDNLKLTYQSDPPLQFEEIVALLATGKRPTSDPTIVANQPPPPQQSVAQMGETAIVSQAVAAPLASRLQRVFGVNQIKIDPTFASGSALPTARITLQQQVSNAITFTYSQDLTQSNSQLIRAEWDINPRFSAVATRDANGIFGVDFYYKRQFR